MKVRQELKPEFDGIRDRIDRLVNDVRQLSHELHPVIQASLGLEEATRQLCRGLQTRDSLEVDFVSRDVPKDWTPQSR